MSSDHILILSPSRVKTWMRCRKQYFWKYNMHLRRVQKESPLELGTIASEIFADYYREPSGQGLSGLLTGITSAAIRKHHDEFLGKSPQPNRTKEWNKIVNVLGSVFTRYGNWTNLVSPTDSELEVKSVETAFRINLVPDQFDLLAIPDSTARFNGSLFVLEHKLRSRYRTGDFGIDYQSVGSCLVAGAIGTIYNVVNYRDLKLHRDVIIRSNEELDYFRNIYISTGEDIVSTPPEKMYPQPMRRCSCSYWELCQAEMQGLDIREVIDALFLSTVHREEPELPEDAEE